MNSTDPPEAVTVRMANAQAVSTGYCQPGDEVTLPGDEAYGLIRAGLAQQVSVP